jgi:hypothetical protein
MGMDGEFVAVYLAADGTRVVFPLVRDLDRAYRLACTDGLRPIRHWIGDLEFSHYQMADPSRSSQFMNQVLTVPVKTPRPALLHNENAA